MLTNFFFPDCPRCVDLACDSLKNGDLIAVPTDTVYGIACLAQNQNAVERIYALKGRNSNKPIAISVGDVADIYRSDTKINSITIYFI